MTLACWVPVDALLSRLYPHAIKMWTRRVVAGGRPCCGGGGATIPYSALPIHEHVWVVGPGLPSLGI